jgi:PAS domain S-box-containing protein
MFVSKATTELKKTIPWTLVVIFLLFTAGILITGLYYYKSQKARIFSAQEDNLRAVSILKINQITQWHNERLGDAATIRDNEPLIRSIRQLFTKDKPAGTAVDVRLWMNSILKEYDYSGVLIVDSRLRVRMSVDLSDTVAGQELQSELQDVLRDKKIILTDLHKSKSPGYIDLDILIPIIDPVNKEKNVSGIIILRVDPQKVLFPLILKWPTSSKSSETLLLRREGDSILYLNELRHMKNTALNLRLSVNKEDLLASKAVRGLEGIIEGIDYRNIPVVGYIAGIPGLPWFMVAKTDKEELQAPIRRYLYFTAFLTFLLVLVNAAVFGFWIWNQRVRFYRQQLKNELDRKKVEEDLLESEERFSMAYKTSPISFMIANMEDGRIIETNDAFTSISGFTREEALTSSTLSLNIWVHEEDRQNMIATLHDGRTLVRQETMLRSKNGKIRTVLLSAQVIQLSHRNCIISSIEDITERKKAEDSLARSKKEFQNYFESGSVGMSVTLPDKKWIEVNQRLCQMFGYTREELIGLTWMDLSHPEDIAENRALFQQVLDGKKDNYELDKRFVRKDGRIVSVTLSVVCERNPDGSVHHFLSSYLDITEKKEFEEMLRYERNLLRTLVDNIPDPISIKDSSCRYILNNKAHLRIIGAVNQADVTGKTSFDFFPKEEASEFYRNEKSVISTGERMLNKLERILNKSTYKVGWHLTSKIPLFDNFGKVTHILTVSHDITDRKKAEDELIRAKEKAEESDRLKTAFLHNISHEIRTPMNAIVGFSALLGEPDNDLQTQKLYIETIMQSSNHLLSIISDIIDISNIEADIVNIARNEINVNSTFISICNQFSLKAGEKKIELVCESGLSDSEALVITDNTKFTQILTNLISNAIKFTDKGSVKVICRKADNSLEISVSDTGIGINADFHEKVFDRFFQVQNTVSRIYEGTGLGLAISKAYVELMGGRIWLSSEPGRGTTFFFTIPYERQTLAPLPVIEKPVYEGFVFPEMKTILVAEDVDSNYKLITYFLSRANTKLLRAVNGKEAVDIALTEKGIDLILMDIKMPEMDGYTAVKLIREADIKIPIIAQTAYADDKQSAIESGCNGFISKPFDKKHLLKVLSEFI